jgi:hypothetical protein
VAGRVAAPKSKPINNRATGKQRKGRKKYSAKDENGTAMRAAKRVERDRKEQLAGTAKCVAANGTLSHASAHKEQFFFQSRVYCSMSPI